MKSSTPDMSAVSKRKRIKDKMVRMREKIGFNKESDSTTESEVTHHY
jgi:hypothetical protein